MAVARVAVGDTRLSQTRWLPADDVSVPPRAQAQLLAAVTSLQTNLKFSIDGAVQILMLANDKDPQFDRVARQLVATLGEMTKAGGRHGVSADAALASRNPYVVGPLQAATPQQPGAELSPVDRFRAAVASRTASVADGRGASRRAPRCRLVARSGGCLRLAE